jgi:hypothetical protein
MTQRCYAADTGRITERWPEKKPIRAGARREGSLMRIFGIASH